MITGRRRCVRGLRTLGDCGLWLILWGLWAVFGCGWVKRSDGRRNSSQSGNGTGRGSPTVSHSVERGAAAVAVEAVRGGGLPRRTSQPRRRNNSEPRERFPPFVFSLPHLSGLYCTFTKQSQNKHNPSTFLKVRHSIYITYTPAEFIIYYTSALLLYYTYTHTPARPCLFFSFFFFFLFLFFFYLFFYLFFYITFLFVCLFAFRRFLFFCFVFLFFSTSIFATVQAAAEG